MEIIVIISRIRFCSFETAHDLKDMGLSAQSKRWQCCLKKKYNYPSLSSTNLYVITQFKLSSPIPSCAFADSQEFMENRRGITSLLESTLFSVS